MMRRLKWAIQKLLRAYGLEIRRTAPPPPAPEIETINLLAFAMSELLWRRHLAGQGPSAFTFIQVGANDGVAYDPLRHFILKYNFQGLLVEPQPDVFARLRENYQGRPGLKFANLAVAGENGTATLYRFKPVPEIPTWADCIATLSRETLVSNSFGFKGEIEELKIPAVTLDTLFRESGFDHLDLLQIDAEGYDYEILKMLEPCRMRPALVNFEHLFLNEEARNECFVYLNRLGYKLARNGADTIAYLEPEDQAETFTKAPVSA